MCTGRVYVTECANRLYQLTESSGHDGRGFGARTHQRTRSQQLCLHRCLKRPTVAKHHQPYTHKHIYRNIQKHRHTVTAHLVKSVAEETSAVYTILQLIQRQWAAPAVSKILAVITKHNTVKDVSFHLRFEN